MGDPCGIRTRDLHLERVVGHPSGGVARGRHKFKIGLNVENLFDQDTVTRIFTVPYRDTFNVSDQVFFSGTFDPVALQASAPGTYRPDPRFKQADQWMQRREMRLELKYSF